MIAVSRRPIKLNRPNVESIVGLLDKVEHLEPLVRRSRTVVHTASRSTPGSSAGHALAELEGNLRPTLALLEALQRHPHTRVLYLSSGGSLYATAPSEFATESSPASPRSYHGAGKIAAEHFINAWCCQYNGSTTILRPSNLYGPGQSEQLGFGIVPAALGRISRGETLPVWGDGSVIRDYLYIADFVALCVAVLTGPMPSGTRLINASSGTGVSLNELFRTMEAITGQPLHRTYDPGRPVDTPCVVMDPTLARQCFGWTAATSLPEGIEKTWAWFNTIRP